MSSEGALAGLRVLDVSTLFAGPMAAMHLGEGFAATEYELQAAVGCLLQGASKSRRHLSDLLALSRRGGFKRRFAHCREEKVQSWRALLS